MRYADAQNMVTRFGPDELIQLTSDSEVAVTSEMLQAAIDEADLSAYLPEEQAATQVCLAAINNALDDAGAETDPYLQARYPLPLSSVPRVLERFNCDMARYYLHRFGATEAVKQRYDNAITFLRQVAAGKASLGLDENEEATPSEGGIHFSAPSRRFTEETLRGFTG